jgi:hypothetical protein
MKRVKKKQYLGIILLISLIIACLTSCSNAVSQEISTEMETEKKESGVYEGMWLSVPLGQVYYNINAEAIWIKSVSNNSIQYETCYFLGTPVDVGGNYSWSIERHTADISDIIASDVEGIECFYADGENVYLDNGKLYFGKYQNDSLVLVKMVLCQDLVQVKMRKIFPL